MKREHTYIRLFALLIAGFVVLLPTASQAYIGPGAGLTAIGAFLALIAAVVLTIVGFVWFPVKRMLRQRRQAAAPPPDTAPQDPPPS